MRRECALGGLPHRPCAHCGPAVRRPRVLEATLRPRRRTLPPGRSASRVGNNGLHAVAFGHKPSTNWTTGHSLRGWRGLADHIALLHTLTWGGRACARTDRRPALKLSQKACHTGFACGSQVVLSHAEGENVDLEALLALPQGLLSQAVNLLHDRVGHRVAAGRLAAAMHEDERAGAAHMHGRGRWGSRC